MRYAISLCSIPDGYYNARPAIVDMGDVDGGIPGVHVVLSKSSNSEGIIAAPGC